MATKPTRYGARWGNGNPFVVRARQKWSGKDLIFTSAITVGKIAGSEPLSVSIDWYDEGSTVWRFPLDGSRQALAEAGRL